MPVFRSRPLARNDSVDVITGTGIVLELPNGFGSGIVFNEMNIIISDSFRLIFVVIVVVAIVLLKYVHIRRLHFHTQRIDCSFVYAIVRILIPRVFLLLLSLFVQFVVDFS